MAFEVAFQEIVREEFQAVCLSVGLLKLSQQKTLTVTVPWVDDYPMVSLLESSDFHFLHVIMTSKILIFR